MNLFNKQYQSLGEIINLNYKSLYSKKDQSLDEVNLYDIIHKSEIKKVSPEAKNKLELDITKQEILEILMKLKNNKSPGADGFTAAFFFGLILAH